MIVRRIDNEGECFWNSTPGNGIIVISPKEMDELCNELARWQDMDDTEPFRYLPMLFSLISDELEV